MANLCGIVFHPLDPLKRLSLGIRFAGSGIVELMTIEHRACRPFHLLRLGEKLGTRARAMLGGVRGQLDPIDGERPAGMWEVPTGAGAPAAIVRPIRPSPSSTLKTCPKTEGIASRERLMKSAIFVKCGLASPLIAMNKTLSC